MAISRKACDELLTLLLEYIPDRAKLIQLLGRAMKIQGNKSYQETLARMILAVDERKEEL